MPSQIKINLVAEIREQVERATCIVVSDYRGLSVKDMTDLRNRLRAQNADLRIIKNRLARIALTEAQAPVPTAYLKGPSAFTFCNGDPVAGPKTLTAYAKDHEAFTIKCGMFEGVVMDAAGVTALASLSSREELLGRLLGDLKSPVTKVALAIKATVNKLAYALQAVAEKKQTA
jgi:large subunit ribosomal protein L10